MAEKGMYPAGQAEWMISAIFDPDGTLMDSEPNHYESGRRTLARHGVPDLTWEQHARFIGIGTLETLEILRDRQGSVRDPGPGGTTARRAERHPPGAGPGRDRVLPRDAEVRGAAARGGVPMAVASGSSREAIDAVPAGTGLDALLTTVVSA
ncbi:HAD hydrolase-like protein [Streptomyces sp. NPDC059761]|uniref:HAD hydrolase-like protein n=1 Tax=Streptomyces sp. NPDC059761 TaxID=3346937 RepID=UPI00365802B0